MLTRLRLENFKSWKDTGEVALRPITGFFGANSSGKSSLIHALLLLKQTADSTDRGIVFNFGEPMSKRYIDLGDFINVVHGHQSNKSLEIFLSWQTDEPIAIEDSYALRLDPDREIAISNNLGFRVVSRLKGDCDNARPVVDHMAYQVGVAEFGLRREVEDDLPYDVFSENANFRFVRYKGRPWKLESPMNCYGFPEKVRTFYQNADFLIDLEFAFEQCLQSVYYLGPLRAFPERTYSWHGFQPSDVGEDGRLVVDALLEDRRRGDEERPDTSGTHVSLEERVANWLKDLGLIQDFRIHRVYEDGGLYSVMVRKCRNAPEVPIADVGFGVSQILPVLVLCFYVPEGSTVILEQPEIHLHPSVQAGLADVFIDAWKKRNVQILVESHSEHLLRRLQRRIAEEELSQNDLGLYFCNEENGVSRLDGLEVDLYGNIANWPKDFFGDQFGEIAAMSEAALNRRP